ncbi:UspA domain protein [Paraburkholderia piptadeniae]|uniref:UspA domain protein n=1 Tax=Paraburkholderia piptadeniae TaxID=1701573 RepID=A0A1N7SSU8_9BURK|nr:universal stress protein [Paraburkholderia piptadeniae]SIT50555.1 UspA domain protein [Paraburkholderia piptadeniae]
MIRHILVAVSASTNDAVLKTAIDKTRDTGARLTAVYVVDTMPWWAMMGAEHGCIDTPQMVHELERVVERRCNDTFDCEAWDIQTRAITVPLRGHSVGREIANLAVQLGADLIVVGAGRGSKWKFWEERMSDVIGRCTRRTVLIATDPQPSGREHDCATARADARRAGAAHANVV